RRTHGREREPRRRRAGASASPAVRGHRRRVGSKPSPSLIPCSHDATRLAVTTFRNVIAGKNCNVAETLDWFFGAILRSPSGTNFVIALRVPEQLPKSSFTTDTRTDLSHVLRPAVPFFSRPRHRSRHGQYLRLRTR